MKLSKTQVGILRTMYEKKTAVILARNGPRVEVYYRGRSAAGKRLRVDSVLKLARLELIEDITAEAWRWRESEYVITQAGISVLKKEVERGKKVV